MNTCKSCGGYVNPFSPSPNYCSKTCEDKGPAFDYLMNIFGMKK